MQTIINVLDRLKLVGGQSSLALNCHTVFKKLVTAFFIVALVLMSLGITNSAQAQVEMKKGYRALQVLSTGSGQLSMQPGQTKQFMVQFQNTGVTDWYNNGEEFVSIYTYDPKYRQSAFRDPSWFQSVQPVKMKEVLVTPDDVGTIVFNLKAPSQEGVYKEMFRLAAEDRAWIPGGEFTININVSNQAKVAPTPKPAVTPASSPTPEVADETSQASSEGLSAMILLRSAKEVIAKGGEVIEYTVGIKNTGTKAWTSRRLLTAPLQIASANDTYHSSWVSSNTLLAAEGNPVNPGALEFMTFKFKAPSNIGRHTVRYIMAANEATIPGFYIDIPVSVTSSAPQAYQAPKNNQASEVDQSNFIEEPTIRVGVLIIDEETDWQIEVSCQEPWQLRDINNSLLGEMQAGQIVRAFYKSGKYHFNRGKGLEQSTYALRFIPTVENSICTAENFDRRVSRNAAHADNTFRNILEIRHNDYKDRTWLINELPIEQYLRGLAETSNSSHEEYQKALVTAARTFAFYHWTRGTKRAKEFFTITAYADDQVYKGYGHELRSPRIAQAAEESKGRIVTFNGELAITPYFSRSDGRTRDWSEVWYGDVEWLKSVPTPCDKRKGRVLWGHGVGMSATEALCMAEEQGSRFDQILKYFYSGVEVNQKWK
ncbi:SpoIID/LytB domain-containing protein [Patescibacteria group bacterium]